jgi:uncharacterized Ntn-hydrolase superfamily protein
MGVAVQSHWFNVGGILAWAQAGVGAVATQSLVDPSYGPLGLALMAAGRSASKSLDGLLLADDAPEIRQVAFVDAQGNVAHHTGTLCIAEAGHQSGEGYSVQANLMDRDTVPAAMAAAYEAAEGDLAERMLAALQAAEAEGGDIRGRQSAALLVVRGEATGQIWNDVLVDLSVEDHAAPLVELGRLLSIHQGYAQMNAGDLAIEAGDMEAAEAAYSMAEALLPGNPESLFWHAVALSNAGELDAALPIFGRVFAQGENWRRLIPRLAAVGLLPDDGQILNRILELD